MRTASRDGVAGLQTSGPGESWDEGVRNPSRRVRVNGFRSVRLVVQAPRDAQVASVPVDTAHVSPARIRHSATLIHIWNTERCTERASNICGGTFRYGLRFTCYKAQVDSPVHCLDRRSNANPSVQVWGEMTFIHACSITMRRTRKSVASVWFFHLYELYREHYGEMAHFHS